MSAARYLLARRAVQFGVLALFWAGAHAGWTILRGNLTSSTVLGILPMSDPWALAQVFATGHVPARLALTGAAITLLFYLLVGGRSFCAWVCPLNPVADLAAWIRRRFDVRGQLDVHGQTRRYVMAVSLLASALLGSAAFERVSPVGFVQRALIQGLPGVALGAVLFAVPLLLLVDIFLLRRGWCGSLCPLGGFWGVVGAGALVRPRFEASRCDRCGDCAVVCPESHVLRLGEAGRAGAILHGDCTNCFRCVDVCPKGALAPGIRRFFRPILPEVNDHATD